MSDRQRPATHTPTTPSSASTPRATASWIIIERVTGRAVLETYDKRKVEAINLERYEARPILEYLVGLNRRTRLIDR